MDFMHHFKELSNGYPIRQLADCELAELLNEWRMKGGGYKLRPDTAKLWMAILRTFADISQSMTLRQVYYRLEATGHIEKTDSGYVKVGKQVLAMRRAKVLPYSWITDGTRWRIKPNTWDSVDEVLDAVATSYRRSLWMNQDCYVEIWLEKQALASVFDRVTREFDVSLMVTKGYPSETYLYNAAEMFLEKERQKKNCILYHFSDYDPSGVDSSQKIEGRLREFGANVYFERACLTGEQIESYGISTRPTKQTDSRAKNFDPFSAELDALHPRDLQAIVRGCIESVVDQDALDAMKQAERLERDSLRKLAQKGFMPTFGG